MTARTLETATQATTPIGGAPTLAEFEAQLESVLDVAYRTAYHLTRNQADAEDVVQEAALNACRHRQGFERGTNFKAWFLRIVTNVFYSRCRLASTARESVSLDAAEEPRRFTRTIVGGADPAESFLDRLDAELVSRAIADLPLEYRVVTTLYLVDDMAYQDIAGLLEIPVGTVRSRLHRGRRQLQHALWAMAAERGGKGHQH